MTLQRSLLRTMLWAATAALIVLAGRALAYALAPSPLAVELQHEAGGPRLVVVALVALGGALAVATAVLWLASIAVRERARLRAPASMGAPRLRFRRLVLRAVALTATTSLAFAAFESYVHWRAGLGFHGLHCVLGPVHANALPILASLSVITAAVASALEHLFAWMRTTVELLLRRRSAHRTAASPLSRPGGAEAVFPQLDFLHALRPRGPPSESPVLFRRLDAAAT
jgi:hypothetical protein